MVALCDFFFFFCRFGVRATSQLVLLALWLWPLLQAPSWSCPKRPLLFSVTFRSTSRAAFGASLQRASGVWCPGHTARAPCGWVPPLSVGWEAGPGPVTAWRFLSGRWQVGPVWDGLPGHSPSGTGAPRGQCRPCGLGPGAWDRASSCCCASLKAPGGRRQLGVQGLAGSPVLGLRSAALCPRCARRHPPSGGVPGGRAGLWPRQECLLLGD